MKTQSLRKFPLLALSVFLVLLPNTSFAKRRAPAGGRVAIVVDERLSALRRTPELSGGLLRRLGRGSLVAIRGEKRGRESVVFYRVNVTSRTSGWIQREALVSPSRLGDDVRLLRLIKGSEDFDLVARARIFLDYFTSSELRPAVLLIYAQAAEDIAGRLSRDASRRLDNKEITAGGAPRLATSLTTTVSIVTTGKASLSFLTLAKRGFVTTEKAGKSWRIVTRAARKRLKRASGLR